MVSIIKANSAFALGTTNKYVVRVTLNLYIYLITKPSR